MPSGSVRLERGRRSLAHFHSEASYDLRTTPATDYVTCTVGRGGPNCDRRLIDCVVEYRVTRSARDPVDPTPLRAAIRSAPLSAAPDVGEQSFSRGFHIESARHLITH